MKLLNNVYIKAMIGRGFAVEFQDGTYLTKLISTLVCSCSSSEPVHPFVCEVQIYLIPIKQKALLYYV